MPQNINIIEKNLQSAVSIVQTTNLGAGDVSGADTIAIAVNVSSVTAAAKSFGFAAVDVTANTITITAHGFLTGEKGQFTTDDTLPAGLSLLTDYYIIKVDADTIKVASSLNNANSGTAIDITDQGAGTDTFTPTALSASVKLQKSLDNSTFVDEIALSGEDVVTSTITTTGLIWIEKYKPKGRYYRLVFTVSAGLVTSTVDLLGKGLN